MSTGQTALTLGAFMFLTTIMLNFYGIVANTGETIKSGQDGILATTIASSYLEIAQGLAFDQITDTSDVGIHNPSVLTSPVALGPEAGEDSLAVFNDFDDFNGYVTDKQAVGSIGIYRTRFAVSYVQPGDIDASVYAKTFAKRMDMKTWRVFPAPTDPNEIDTVRMSFVLGYFHFD